MTKPIRIFLSYAHADADGVGRIYAQLKERGYKPLARPGRHSRRGVPSIDARLRSLTAPWQQGQVELEESRGRDARTVRAPALERTFGREREIVSLQWYKGGLSCASSVARIETTNGQGMATGFLVMGSELHRSLSHEPLLLANAYVVTNDETVRSRYAFSASQPDQIQVRFQLEHDDPWSGPAHAVEVVWTSFDAGTTIMRLKPGLENARHLAIAQRLPVLGEGQQAYIIGHAGGRDLAFSFTDGVILDYDDRVIHYRTPTEPGSSGSPVFNQKWQVMAIHSAAGSDLPRLNGATGTYAAGEGILIDAVRRALDAEGRGTP